MFQSFFDLPKTTIRNDSSINILLKQTLKDVEKHYRDDAGLDVSRWIRRTLKRSLERWRTKLALLQDLKLWLKVNNLFVTKPMKHLLDVHQKQVLFKKSTRIYFFWCLNKLIYSAKKRCFARYRKISRIEIKLKQVRSEENLCEQGFHYDIKELLETITKTVDKTSKSLMNNLL